MKKIKLSSPLIILIFCLIGIKSYSQSPAAGTATFTTTGTLKSTAGSGFTTAVYVPTTGGITNGVGLEFIETCTATNKAAITSVSGGNGAGIIFGFAAAGTISDVRIRSAATGAATTNQNTPLPTPGGEFKISSLNVILNTAGSVTITFTGYKNGTSVITQNASVSSTSKTAVTLTAPEWNCVDDVQISGFLNTSGVSVDDLVIGVATPTIAYSTPQTYTAGVAITSLSPTGSSTVDPYGFSSLTTQFSNLGTDVPYSINTDASGNVYVVDYTSAKIYKYTSTGTQSTLVSTGMATPVNIAIDPSGYIYVTDYGTSGKLYRFSSAGALLGTYTGLNNPLGVTTDAAGNVYVANGGTNTVLKMAPGVTGTTAITGANTYLTGFPSTPVSNGVYGLTFDISGNLFVSDYQNSAIYKIASGSTTITTFVSSGLSNPRNMSFDGGGNLYVADYTSGSILKVTSAGVVSTLVSGLTNPRDVSVDPSGNMFIANSGGFDIRKDVESGGYAISASLPTGLSFSTTTGVISGTPTTNSSATTYTVTAYNSTATGTTTVNITVNRVLTTTNLTTAATSPISYGQTGLDLFGFTVTALPAVTANTFTLQSSANTGTYLTNGKLYSSTTSTTYPTGFAQVAGATVTFGASTVTISGLSETISPGTPVSYFVVADFTGTGAVSGSFNYSINTSSAFITSPASLTSTTAATGASFSLGNVYNWKGTTNSWTTNTNFTVPSGANAASAPGTNDIVQVGVIAYTGTFDPVVTSNSSISKLIFGTLSTPQITVNTGVTLTLNGDMTNSGTGTVIAGTGTIAVGGDFTNTGTFAPGSSTINFTGASPTLNSSSAIPFTNLTFSGSGTATLATGTYSVSSTGTLTLSGTASLATGGFLTLKSDATGSSTVGQIPSGSTITGNVTVQRYFSGGAVGTQRAYRLLSPPVNSNSVTNNSGSTAYFSPASLSNLYTGGPGGPSFGFTAANSGTSTVFLYREDTPINTGSFNSGNYKGIANMSTTPFPVSQLSGTYSLWTGNGLMLYYVGSVSSGTTFNTKVSGAYPNPDNTTATFTGTLNQGTIPVKLWFGTTSFPYTSTGAQGYYLVGNPYAATIDLNTFSNAASDPGTGFWGGPNMANAIYIYDYSTKTFNTWTPGVGSSGGNATRYVASGQAFFVRAPAVAGAQLKFYETAKATSANNPTGVNLLMGAPVAADPRQFLHLKVSQDAVNYNEVLIVFGPNTKDTYETDADIEYMKGIGNSISLNTFATGSGLPLAVNQMHSIDSLTRVKLNVGSTISGVDTLSGTGLDKLDQRYDAYIVDHYKKDSTLFSAGTKYLFNINLSDTSSFGSTRFELAFHKKASLINYKLLSFTATKVTSALQAANNGILLTWKVQNEDKYTGFTIQRADGSLQFLSLYTLQSDGSGTYTYTDHTPLAGVNKYRLMQNGTFDNISYSEIITLGPPATAAIDPITLYPNPVINQLQINMANNPPSQVHLTIMNTSSGLVMMSKDVSSTNIQENVGTLFAGNYLVEISDTSTKKVIGRKKFIKL